MKLGNRGVTLVELMVAVAFLSVVTISSALVYTTTMKALIISKGNNTAARLAQDKFETMQGLSYPLLIVTPQTDLNIPPGVDLTNYPPENFNMGGKVFTRSVVVKTVFKDASGNIVALGPDATDTGLKQVTVQVTYSQGTTTVSKSYALVISDPHVVPMDGLVYGVVTDTAGIAVSNAKLFVTENQNWTTQASSTGYYQIPTDTGTYTITAIEAGFWDNKSGSVTPIGNTLVNMQLTRMATGRVSGTVTVREQHLVVSRVYAGSLTDSTVQFIELYNPTTAPITITDGAAAQIKIVNCRSDNSTSVRAFTWSGTGPINAPAQGYFLIASASPTVNSAVPDALFAAANPIADTNKGGIAVQDSFGVGLDSVAWSNGGSGPANCMETTAVPISAGNFGSNGVLVRKTSPTGFPVAYGNSFNDGDNSNDLALYSSVAAGTPSDRASAAKPVGYGVPASSADVLATDGYSPAAFASTTGYYMLNAVTTGTWSVASYWTSYSTITDGSIQINSGATTSLDLLLEPGSSGQGGAAGRVLRSDTLTPLSGIIVKAGTNSTLTDAAGNYVLSLASGSYSVEVNPSYSNMSYDTLSSTVTVSGGAIHSGLDFNLNPAGKVMGKVTTNGTAPYPDIIVGAVSQGLLVASAVTDSLGNYSLYGIPVGSVSIAPQLDPAAQVATPAAQAAAMTQGATLSGNDFTVKSSLGIISGTVNLASQPITTGVLVVATTSTFTTPPTVDNAYRTGASIVYNTVSDSAGNFSVTVVKNSTYTLYGYLVQLNGHTATTTTSASRTVYISSSVSTSLSW